MHRFGYDLTLGCAGGATKLSFCSSLNKFYSFYEESEHAC